MADVFICPTVKRHVSGLLRVRLALTAGIPYDDAHSLRTSVIWAQPVNACRRLWVGC